MITVVYGHPNEKSFNHAVLEAIVGKFKDEGKEHAVMDLYADHFDPAIRQEDFSLYGKGQTTDPVAKMYMDILGHTDTIYFVYPIWWGCEPAIIRGFYDAVLLKGIAWEPGKDGALAPLLKISKTGIFTTSEGPTAAFAPYFGDYLPNHILNNVGMTNVEWHNLDNITGCGDQARQAYLASIPDLV